MPQAQEPYTNLHLIDFNSPNLIDILKQQGLIDLYGNNNPFERIISLARSHRCKTIIVEHNYIDEDYLEEFSFHYSTIFKNVRKDCIRLHFFSVRISNSDLLDLTKYAKKYIGYTVVKPISAFRTGRTVIKPFIRSKSSEFILCKASFKVNLSGSELEINGMPFVQQDTYVGVCAHAGMWMASLYMHKNFSYPRYLPANISKTAVKYFDNSRLEGGLVVEQMTEVLRTIGFKPIFFPHFSVDESAKIIYSYIESEIPVLLLISTSSGGHVVTVIGHSFSMYTPPSGNFFNNADWVQSFFIHDDAAGPYLKFTKNAQRNSYSIEGNLQGVIVPSPKEVYLDSLSAEKHAIILLRNINLLINALNISYQKQVNLFKDDELKELVLRVNLRSSNNYKSSLSKKRELNLEIKKNYRAIPMPKYIWVIEISKKELLNKRRANERKIIGEIIIDSTANIHAGFESFIAFHLSGRAIIKNQSNGTYYHFEVPNDLPYGHLVR